MTAAPTFRPIVLRTLDAAGIVYQAVSDGAEVLLDCPDCGKSGHLYVNVLKRESFCQRCKQGSSWLRLRRVMHLPRLAEVHALPAPRPQDCSGLLGRPKPATSLPIIELPWGSYPAVRFPEAIAYLESRHLSVHEAFTYDLQYCPYGPYAQRLVFPVTWEHRLVGFQARTIAHEDPPYLFPKGFPGARVLYPERNLRAGRVYVTEGVIPAITCQGLATFGKKLSTSQLEALRAVSRYVKQVVLLWDRDAWQSERNKDAPAMAAWKRLKEWYPTVGLILPPEKPQPDHFLRHVLFDVGELVFAKSRGKSAIFRVDPKGHITREGW